MCKISIITSHSPRLRDSLIRAAWQEMATTERDGFGAAWFSNTGELAWVKSSVPAQVGDMPAFVDGWSASHKADVPSDGGFLIIHGRTATCDIHASNCHPMLAEKPTKPTAALVHNGVVSSELFANRKTTCDSELLLLALLDAKGIAGVKSVSGYYAFGLLQLVDGAPHLTVARDSSARLEVGRRGSALVFATTADLLEVLKAERLGPLESNTCLTFHRGKVTQARFTPTKAPSTLYSAASKALGTLPASDPYLFRSPAPTQTRINYVRKEPALPATPAPEAGDMAEPEEPAAPDLTPAEMLEEKEAQAELEELSRHGFRDMTDAQWQRYCQLTGGDL